jgi:hypothetical protein
MNDDICVGRCRIVVVVVVVTVVLALVGGRWRMERAAKRMVGGGKGRVLCLFGNRSEINK